MNGASPEMIELFLAEASEHLQFLREYSGILQDPYPLYEDIERLYISAHGVAGTGGTYGYEFFQEVAGQTGAYLPVRHERDHQPGGYGSAGGVHLRSHCGARKRPDYDRRQRHRVGRRYCRIQAALSLRLPVSPAACHRRPN